MLCIKESWKRTSAVRWNTAWSCSGGKWNSRIICVLAALGTLRYSRLRREMGNITDAVLASTLKGLIANGIVERWSYDEIPPRVEYTPDGKRCLRGADSAEHLPVGGCVL